MWWYLFLIIAPKQYKDYVESARGYYDKGGGGGGGGGGAGMQ